MRKLTPAEIAAVAEAERQGRITQLSSCPFWGGAGFKHLFMAGDELAGGVLWKRRGSDFDCSTYSLRKVERDVIAGRIA